jgi:hypothetical protein
MSAVIKKLSENSPTVPRGQFAERFGEFSDSFTHNGGWTSQRMPRRKEGQSR